MRKMYWYICFVWSWKGACPTKPSTIQTHGFKTVHNLELAPHANMKWSCLLWLSVIRDRIVFLYVYWQQQGNSKFNPVTWIHNKILLLFALSDIINIPVHPVCGFYFHLTMVCCLIFLLILLLPAAKSSEAS